jgi:hypothetical protein
MNKRQWYVLTAGWVLTALSCLFPLWRPASGDFTFLFSPPPLSTPDFARLALEWLFLASVTGIGLLLTRTRPLIPIVYPIMRHRPILDALPEDVLNKWHSGKRQPK